MINRNTTYGRILEFVAFRAIEVASRYAIIASLLIHPPVDSQTHERQYEHLTVEQGLSSDNVLAILQDSRGFMWFGTDNGLNKYDGYVFTVYMHDPYDSSTISGNNIPFIYEDKSGTLWLRGPGGQLNRFDRATEKFTRCLANTPVLDIHEDASGTLWFATSGGGLKRFDRASGTFRQYSLSNDTLYSICEDSGEAGNILWIGTARGLDRFDIINESFTQYKHGSRNQVNTIHGDRFGLLWVGTNEGLYRFAKISGTFTHYPVEGRISESQGKNEILRIYEDSGGILWIGTADGLATFRRSTGTFTFYQGNRKRLLDNERVQSICEDGRGRLWFGTMGGGLRSYDWANNKFTFYIGDPKNSSSLNDYVVNTIYEDKSGTLWFGTGSGGVNKIDRSRKAFSNYAQDPTDSKSLSDKAVTGVVEDKSGVLWVATIHGLNRFDRETGSFIHYYHNPEDPSSLGSDLIYSLLVDSGGTIWVGTLGRGLDRLDPVKSGRPSAKFIHYSHDPTNPNSLGSNSILSLFEDKARNLWIGTRDAGLEEYDRGSGVFRHHRGAPHDPGSLGSPWVNAIYEDKSGVLWVGVAGGGLNKLDGATGKFMHYVHDDKNPRSLSYSSVHSIYEDSRGTLWVGTAAGLNRFERSTETFTHFSIRDGIASDFITAILEDSSGCLWLKTLKGVSKFNPRTGAFRNYDASDGVNIYPTWGKSSYKTRNGEMFFGGTNGFIRFHPDSIRDNPYICPIVITALKKFDKSAPLDTAIAEKKEIELSYRDNVFSFEFVALNFTSPEKNQYAYKLEGFDDDWIYCGTRRYASYTNLDGGTYVFKAKGSNNDGVWNEVGTSITVIVTPPFWKTWWFRIPVILALFGAAGGTIRYVEISRLRRKMRDLEQKQLLERERVRISGDLHDELASNLSSIAMLSKILSDDTPPATDKIDRLQVLDRIAALSSQSVESIRDIIWAIDPKNETMESLFTRLQDMLVVLCRAKNIRLRIERTPSEGLPSGNLLPELRRNLWLLLKEAVNNSLKHSQCSQLSVHAQYEGGKLSITVQDNGRGYDTSQVSTGKGLRTMEMRAKQIGGVLRHFSAPDDGTTVTLIVNVENRKD